MCLINTPYAKVYAVYKTNGKPAGKWKLLWLFSTNEYRSLWLNNTGDAELRDLASRAKDRYNRAETANYALQDYQLDYPLRCH